MSNLQRRVARSQTKGEMIKAVSELRQTAQMWKSLYDEQTVNMAKMGEEFNVAYNTAMEEVEMTKAITYMMLFNEPGTAMEVSAEQINAFNLMGETEGSWEIDIEGGDEEGFTITLERVEVEDDGSTPDPEGEDDEEEDEETEDDQEEEVADEG